MDNASTYHVKPNGVGFAPDCQRVALPGFELWMNYIENVHVVPQCIDPSRFCAALALSLQVFRHAAGQLHRNDGEWEILLTDSPVPVEVERIDANAIRVGDDTEAVDWVIQPNLKRFYAHRDASSSSSTHTAPLLYAKLTLSRSDTAIGVSWHHTLGDASVLLHFMQSLSHHYSNPGKTLGPTVPTFTKRAFPRPTKSLIHEYTPLIPHLAQTCPEAELGAVYGAMSHGTSRVAFRITLDRLERLRSRVVAALASHHHSEGEQLKPSRHDCLIAFIVGVLNRHLHVPITTVTNVASYRSVPGVVHHSAVAGNAICIIPTTLDPSTASGTLADNAHRLRASLTTARTPAFVEAYMSVASNLMHTAVNSGRAWWFAAPPGRASVNSNAALAWHSVHFGCPGRARFYTSGTNDRYIRVFRSNPDPPSAPQTPAADRVLCPSSTPTEPAEALEGAAPPRPDDRDPGSQGCVTAFGFARLETTRRLSRAGTHRRAVLTAAADVTVDGPGPRSAGTTTTDSLDVVFAVASGVRAAVSGAIAAELAAPDFPDSLPGL
ncbi:uncharacterized protein BXZ73DRAFT_95870 [Epithele typhae]|uniref:uncharacterized protein n=1 Tax=Epithele typhae TaxID=378194 RepID=UPI002007682F|nr:uncharacterized protein BXZ73DRAFT_95870 [Epithele typhae]KAH9946372.1 hypothetical protein BXZ73DRAFT_95870 [Epithele typhae]